MEKCKLSKLLGVRSEIGEAIAKYADAFEVILLEKPMELQEFFGSEDALLIAATDETIARGKQYKIATMAYMSPDISNQSCSGVDMIVEGFEEVNADFLEKVWQRCHHLPWKIAETKRCIIRELSLEDLDALFELYSDEEISKFTENLYPYEEEKEFQLAYINNMYRFYGYGMWLVFSKETGELIGRAGLEHREYKAEIELELGYVIGAKFQRQGYATEVCEKIIEIAKTMTDFPRINCLIDAENVASIALAQKLGFHWCEDIQSDNRKMERYQRHLV